MSRASSQSLERLCKQRSVDWMRVETVSPDLSRIDARFSGHAYDKHRHDFYAIGYTIAGVQSFGYRGGTLNSLSGTCMILHPDEAHDGHAGTEEGFRYRMVYINPAVIQDALGERCGILPFVQEAVQCNDSMLRTLQTVLSSFDVSLDALQIDDFLASITDELMKQSKLIDLRRHSRIDRKAIGIVKDFLDASMVRQVLSSELEALCGLDRFTIARQFRSFLGTSPYQYLMSRRIAAARKLIDAGMPLASVACDTGFVDQSHMTRCFKRSYGVTPNAWRKLTHSKSVIVC